MVIILVKLIPAANYATDDKNLTLEMHPIEMIYLGRLRE